MLLGGNGRRGVSAAAGVILVCLVHIAAWLLCIYGNVWP